MTGGQDESRRGPGQTARLPLDSAERKKLVLVVVLAAVCALVVVVQLWRRKAPAAAQAATGTAAAQTVDLDAAVRQMQTATERRVVDKHAAFATVDEALDLFLGGAKPAAVPVEALRPGVFGLPELAATKQAAADADALKAAPEPEAVDPDSVALAGLHLETVLVSARNRAAIINGQVLHCGESIEGYKVTAIEQGRVALTRNGKRFALTLD